MESVQNLYEKMLESKLGSTVGDGDIFLKKSLMSGMPRSVIFLHQPWKLMVLHHGGVTSFQVCPEKLCPCKPPVPSTKGSQRQAS